VCAAPAGDDPLNRQIRTLRHAARLVLWTEVLALALWPAAILAVGLGALALIGMPAPLAGLPALLLLAGGLGLLAHRGLRGFAAPRAVDAERRLERDGGLLHRPFAVLRDQPAGGGPGQAELWAAHQARARDALANLRLRGPAPGIAAQDPYALRAAALLLLTAAVVVAGPRAGDRLASAFLPHLPSFGAAPVVQAWVEPPPYTGQPLMFLPGDGSGVTVPAGTKLHVTLTGAGFGPYLTLGGRSEKFARLSRDSWQAQLSLTEDGTLRVTRFFGEVAHWPIKVLPNDPPVVAWDAPPGQAPKSLATRLPWHVSQRWGVASLSADMVPDGHPNLPALRVPVPLPGTPKDAQGVAGPDLSANPYAGLPMRIHLAARDVSGQMAESPTVTFTLPARQFRNPLAKALADLRRRLALDPADQDSAAADLDALAEARQSFGGKPGIYLNLVSVAALLRDVHGLPAFNEAEDRLYTIAMALDGLLPDASARALDEARDSLRQGFADHARGKLSDSELKRRMEALQQALDKRMADLAQQAVRQGALAPFDPHAQRLTNSAIDKLMQKMQQALRAGKMDEARQHMAELEKMLDKLNQAKILSPKEAQQRAEQAKRGRQMMGAVQDIIKRESGLMDHAQSRSPAPMAPIPRIPGFNLLPPPPPDTGNDDPADDAARDADAHTQKSLARALDALKGAFGASGGEVPKNFDDASRAMDQAHDAFADGDDPTARAAAGRAIAALQKGGQDMARQMSPQGGQMQLGLQPNGGDSPGGESASDQGEGGDDQDGHSHDPFGRSVDGNGGAGDDPKLHVPDQMEEARSRAIQDELRRRDADRQRKQQEREYIERLLNPF
jgi:uncharacterized protein (TIGR02302 family)